MDFFIVGVVLLVLVLAVSVYFLGWYYAKRLFLTQEVRRRQKHLDLYKKSGETKELSLLEEELFTAMEQLSRNGTDLVIYGFLTTLSLILLPALFIITD